MFPNFKRRLDDVRTLTKLCTLAEQVAREQGRTRPGSEHFILAALALPDRTAARAFQQLGLTEERFRDALVSQRTEALESVGISIPTTGVMTQSVAPAPEPILYETEPSGQILVKRLTDSRRERRGRGLLGADVVLAAAEESFTPSIRAFQKLGISTTQLTDAARQAIASDEPASA